MSEELWKPILHLPAGYEVSSYGNVRIRLGDGSIKNVKLAISSGLYAFTAIFQTFYVHVEVARAFLPNPENKRMVIHIDGNKRNNNVENLKWSSAAELTADCYRRGHGASKVIRCVETGEVFSTINSAAYYLGILPIAITESATSGDSCFGLHFEYINPSDGTSMAGSIYMSDKEYVKQSKALNSLKELHDIIKNV